MKSEKEIKEMVNAYELTTNIEKKELEHSRETTKKQWIIRALKWVLGEDDPAGLLKAK